MGTRRTPRRLLAASRDLARKERQIFDFLGLQVQPRLTLLDEASARHLTAEDRRLLDQKEEETGRDVATLPPVSRRQPPSCAGDAAEPAKRS